MDFVQIAQPSGNWVRVGVNTTATPGVFVLQVTSAAPTSSIAVPTASGSWAALATVVDGAGVHVLCIESV